MRKLSLAVTAAATVTTWAVAAPAIAADLRWEGDRFEDDLNSRVLESALTAAIRADWTLRPGLDLYLAADNLFDEEVEVAESGEGVEGFGPPRTLRIGVRLSR